MLSVNPASGQSTILHPEMFLWQLILIRDYCATSQVMMSVLVSLCQK